MRKLSLMVCLFGLFFWYGFGLFNLNNANIVDFSFTLTVIAIFFTLFVFSYYFFYIRAKKVVLVDIVDYHNFLGSKTVAKVSLLTLFLIVAFFVTKDMGMLGYHIIRLMVVAGIASYVFSLYAKGISKLLLLGLFGVVMLLSAGLYSRRAFLSVIAAVIVCRFVRGNPLSVKRVFSLAIGGLGAFMLLAYVTGLRQNNYMLTDLVGSVVLGLGVFATGSGFDTIFLTDYVIQNYDIGSYLWGESFIAGLLNLVPRAIWESKPIAFSITLSAHYFGVGVDETFTNFGPGIVAEAYANGGVLFVVIVSLLMGACCGYADVLVERKRKNPIVLLFASVFYTALFFMVRGDFVNSFYEIYFKFGGAYVLLLASGVALRIRSVGAFATLRK